MSSLGRPRGSITRRGRAHRVDAAIRRTTYRALCREMGSRLRQLREERDISVEELALSIRRSKQTVFAWERGRSAASLVSQLAISQALNCALVDLMPESAHHR